MCALVRARPLPISELFAFYPVLPQNIGLSLLTVPSRPYPLGLSPSRLLSTQFFFFDDSYSEESHDVEGTKRVRKEMHV